MSQSTEESVVFGYKLTPEVEFGQGEVSADGPRNIALKPLILDIYEPLVGPKTLRPAVVLVHGGAFHRGSRRSSPFDEQGAVHSMMEDYARLLAPLGYVCFVIDYRLVPDHPIPEMEARAEGLQNYEEAYTAAGLERTNLVRRAMDLEEVEDSEEDKLMLWNGVLAAMEDANKAVSFVLEHAKEYGVDPERIAIGGHSAGAATTLNTGLGLRPPVKAIFPMSPPVIGFDFGEAIDEDEEQPAVLLFLSQNDEPACRECGPDLIKTLGEKEVDCEFAWVPGFGHFYPSGAVSLSDDGTRMSVGKRIERFLEKHVGN